MNVRTAAIAAAAFLTACSHSAVPHTPPLKSTDTPLVYVGNTRTNTITVYPITGGAPVGTISNGVNYPLNLVLDSQGNLYSGNFNNNTITEYNSAGSLIRTISNGVGGPYAMAIDSKGNLYSANASTVTVYPPGATSPSLTLSGDANSVAVDANGTVYVSNPQEQTVTEFAAGSSAPLRTLAIPGIPQAIAVNTSVNNPGELAVAACGVQCGSGQDAAYLFAAGQSTYYATLTDVNQPGDIAYDHIGNVYIANQGGWISVYALNVYTAAMEDLPCGPVAIAIDGENDLIETDLGNDVQVYPYQSKSPAWTFTNGIGGPWGVAATQ